jgi:hypothetical protein
LNAIQALSQLSYNPKGSDNITKNKLNFYLFLKKLKFYLLKNDINFSMIKKITRNLIFFKKIIKI